MKKGFLFCVFLTLCAIGFNSSDGVMPGALEARAADLFEPRIAGTAGSFFEVVVDTADTMDDGTYGGELHLADTLFSDTIDILNYDFVTVYGKLVSFDIGGTQDDDTTGDSIIVQMFTTINKGTANWLVVADTFLEVGDSFRHHFVVDTMLYNQIFWRTIYTDTLNPTDNDVNTYYFDLDVLGR